MSESCAAWGTEQTANCMLYFGVMKIVYVDESAKDNEVYLFGGLVVDEQQCENVSKRLDGIAKKVAKDYAKIWFEAGKDYRPFEAIEFHAVKLAQGKDYWHEVDRGYRIESVYKKVLQVLNEEQVKFFLNGINIPLLKKRYTNPHPERDLALAHLLCEVQKQTEGHLLALADDHYTKKTSRLKIESIRHYSRSGYCRPGVTLQNYLDTVFFGDSLNSRLIQAADMVTYLYCRRWQQEKHDFKGHESKDWYEKEMKELFGLATQITVNASVFP